MTHGAEGDALDLEAIADKWLLMCPPCDGGLAMGCTHPGDDYRPVMLALVREIERLRHPTRGLPVICTCGHGPAAHNDETGCQAPACWCRKWEDN